MQNVKRYSCRSVVVLIQLERPISNSGRLPDDNDGTFGAFEKQNIR